MALEPTDQQLEALADAIWEGRNREAAEVLAEDAVRVAWPLIRDMVLEAAAEAFETGDPDTHLNCYHCDVPGRLRSMKGR